MNERKSNDNIETLRKSGIVKLKGENMFSIWVKTACCNLNSKQLRKLADISDKYARSFLLFSSRQIPIIPHIHWDDVEDVKNELANVELELDRCGPRVRNINVCYDDKVCHEAVTNSIALAEKLEVFFRDTVLHKIKIGVAGCKKDCIISRVLNDISFVGVGANGSTAYYDVYVGGRLGLKPFIGVKMAEYLPDDQAVQFVQNYFDLIKSEGKPGDRSADLIKRLGKEDVRQKLNRNLQTESAFTIINCKNKINETEPDAIILKIRATCGEVTSPQLRKIADVAEQYGKGIIHFGVRGSPEIPGVDKKSLGEIKRELTKVDLQTLDQGIDNIQACFGEYCTESVVNNQSLLQKIDGKIATLKLNNQNIKISGSGCPNSCGIAHINDLGFLGEVKPGVDDDNCVGCEICVPVCKVDAMEIAGSVVTIDYDTCKHCGQCISSCPFDAIIEEQKGFTILAGGKEGEDTRFGKVLAEFLSEEEALSIIETYLTIMKETNANVSEIIDREGFENFKNRLIPDAYSQELTI
ncbi:MAG: 4Fe-4S dicluster domain-containing protein [Simkaniaceae bacterium]|nr:4Fe-4S dicluster domain-containing protein [Simkaniaceae bacterium]